MRAVCPRVPAERPCLLRYEPSSFRKDHRPWFCPRPRGTSLCPRVCLQVSGRFWDPSSQAVASQPSPCSPSVSRGPSGEEAELLFPAAWKKRSDTACCQWETPGERAVLCCLHRAPKASRAQLPSAEPAGTCPCFLPGFFTLARARLQRKKKKGTFPGTRLQWYRREASPRTD